jgi:hypothetical protein
MEEMFKGLSEAKEIPVQKVQPRKFEDVIAEEEKMSHE